MRSNQAILALALLAALLAVGCGGSDSDKGNSASAEGGNGSARIGGGSGGDGSGGENAGGASGKDEDQPLQGRATVGKAEFIRQVTAICEETAEKIFAEARPALIKTTNKPFELKEAVETRLTSTVIAPNLEAEIDAIRDLDVPAGDGEEVEAILDEIQEVVDTAKTKPRTLTKGVGGQPFAKAEKLADGYGLKECPNG